jgi:nucleoside phosphorylase
MQTLQPGLTRKDYTVGWVCAIPIELAAAQEMLDEEYPGLPQDVDDSNIYTLGRIGEHNVVIACLPAGQMGNNSAASLAVQMKSRFNSIRFGLMVGIGGGVPSAEHDVRLGDVVVSQPFNGYGGVVQYDFGKTTTNGFVRTGFLNAPPTILLNAVASIRAKHLRRRASLSSHLSKLNALPEFTRGHAGPDVLFDATYKHSGGADCRQCGGEIVQRQPRDQEVMVHFGTIASGNQVMRDAATRDRVSTQNSVVCSALRWRRRD